jgi:alanine racemase
MSAPRRALAQVDLAAVRDNCRHLRSLLTGGAELCAVVKADAYGHGQEACARAALEGGAGWLAVATAEEADSLRGAGIEARVLVMGALTSEDLRTAIGADADVVVWDPAFVATVSGAAVDRPVRVHVKLDTGMGRLGARDEETAGTVLDAVAEADGLQPAGLMTHFATADESGDEHFPAQLERFTRFAGDVKARFPELVLHAANSAATYREPASHFDMVRCGVGVYGLDPFGEDPTERDLRPAMRLSSYVSLVKRFEPGQSAGYGRRWIAESPTRLAVLPIGYGDGVRRALTNNAEVLIRGVRRPLVGTVSMDNITVDLGPDTDVEVGDEAVLIGEQGSERILAEELAARLGTINYEITCGVSARVPRSNGAS